MSKQADLILAKQYFEEVETLYDEANYEKAMELSQKSMALYEKWEDWGEWVYVGSYIGAIYKELNQHTKGIAYLNHVIEVGESHIGNNHPSIAKCLNNIGSHHFQLGDYTSALQFYQKALDIWKSSLDENHPTLSIGFSNLGRCYALLQDYDFAIIHMQESLRVQEKNGETKSFPIAVLLSNIGLCFGYKGEYDRAIEYYEQSVSIRKELFGEQHPKMIDSLSNMGLAYKGKKEYETAIHYFQKSIGIVEQSLGEEDPFMTFDLTNLGVCYNDIQKYDLGIQCLQKAIRIEEENFGRHYPGIASNLVNMGAGYYQKGDYALALESYQKGLIVLNTNFADTNIYHNPTGFVYTDVDVLRLLYANKAAVLLKQYQEKTQKPKDLQAALASIQIGIAFISDLRQSYKMEGSVHTLAKESTFVYDDSIEIGLEMVALYEKQPLMPTYAEFPDQPKSLEEVKDLVFGFSEQCKATLLLSNLKDAKAKLTVSIPNEILEQEKELQKKLSDLDKQIMTIEGEEAKKGEVLLSQLQSDYFRQKQEYDALIEKIEKDYPEYHQLKYSISTASIQDLQSYLLSHKVSDTLSYDKKKDFNILESKVETLEVSDTYLSKPAILSYHISDKKIYIHSVTSNDYQITAVEKPSDFSNVIKQLQNAIHLGHIENFIESATQLFDVLLRPVWNFLQLATKLIVIPHGELYYLPFDVLLNQQQITDAENFEKLPYLIKYFDISYHYSATLLLHSSQRQKQTNNQVDSFFGLAPIQFETSLYPSKGGSSLKKEGYVVKSSGKEGKNRRRILKSSGDSDMALQDLEETEVEVKEVYQLFEEQGKEAIALFYDQANKKNLQEHIGGYKYVLISTHGFLQESGKNTLSGIHLASRQTVDDGRKTELEMQSDDYILHTSETYHLNLNADLVVLSSCESGVGELKVGEGMMALNRGFLYAGAGNIVYSLFKVPQDSTSQLTQSLFRYILEGNTYAQALRKAKLGLIEDEMMEPMDWAGFALVGG